MARIVLVAVLAALVAAAPATGAAPFGSGAPGFTVYAAPEDMPNVNNAGEPSIGVNFKTGRVLYQAYASTYAITFDDRTNPAGVLFEDAENPTGSLNLDPILFTDPELGRTWGGGLQGPCGNLAFTDTDGAPWKLVKPCSGTVDHQTIGAGPYAGPPPPGASFPHAAYYCAQFPLSDACVRSIDGGASWGSPVPIVGCTGLHGHVKVGPDGTAYVPNKTCDAANSQPRGVGGGISIDSGATWISYTIPGAESPNRGFDPSVGITKDNVVYEAWGSADGYHPMVSRSTDHGVTWERTTDLAQTVSPALVATTFHSVVGGDPGRVAVAFLGTQVGDQTLTVSPFDPGFEGVWHLFVSTTFDGGQTWTTTRVTGDPVQRGCIWDRGGVSDCRNLLDFMDAQVTRDGRVVVGFADGCILDCAGPDGTTADSISAVATVARQSSGRGLFAAFDGGAGSAAPSPAGGSATAAPVRPRACFRHRERGRVAYVDGRCSTDADGRVRRYRWKWGDGRRASRGAVAHHRYRRRGRYRVTLTVTDDSGLRSRARRKLKVPVARPEHKPKFGEPDGH